MKRAIGKSLKEVDVFVRQLIEQYRGQFQKEYDSIKGSIQNMIDEVAGTLEQKIVANEIEAQESLEAELKQQIADMNNKLESLITEFKEFILRKEEKTEKKFNKISETILEKVSKYIEDNPRIIRKSFFNFKKKNDKT